MSGERDPVRLEDMPSVLDTEESALVARVDPDTIRDLTRIGALKRLLYTRKHQYAKPEIERFLHDSADPTWWEPFGEALAELRAKRRSKCASPDPPCVDTTSSGGQI